MGLSFHYSGCFRQEASLSEMIEEVKDIAEVYKWKYTIYKDQFSKNEFDQASYNQNINGISITPPNCETVSLTFLSNGKMSCPSRLIFFGKTDEKPEQEYLYMLSVKTQYAGIQVHMVIINLIRYLEKKYFNDFKLIDEGQYWETGDEKLLQETFNRYTNLINDVSDAIEGFTINPGETFESYFERLLKQIQNKPKTDQ